MQLLGATGGHARCGSRGVPITHQPHSRGGADARERHRNDRTGERHQHASPGPAKHPRGRLDVDRNIVGSAAKHLPDAIFHVSHR
jgi:hypothetical protein